MRIAGMIKNSVVNGIGVRDVIFFQGCEHRCKGCHNPHTWNKDGGEERTIDDVLAELSESNNNVTISGGEPLLQFDSLVRLLMKLHSQGKTVWLYTGYTFEELPYYVKWMLSHYVEVLIDGRFEEDKKDLSLAFRGSLNQRLINLPKSVELCKLVEWEGVNA